jgi:hypothetical protein
MTDASVPARECGHPLHVAGCRACREYSAFDARRRYRLRAYGRWQPPYVDAAPVREHVLTLKAAGIGWERVARIAGVPPATVSYLLYGCPAAGRPPSGRIRPGAAARLLAVIPSLDLLAGKARTDAAGTRRRLQALAAAGHTREALRGRLGIRDESNFSKLLTCDRVSAATARAVRGLYDELWDVPPDESTPQAAALARRARKRAAALGWPLPMAWDDDTIDDPAARPADDWKRGARGTSAGLAEDAAELLARGLDRNAAAARLEVKRDTLDAAIARSARRTEAQQTSSADTTGERSDAAA